MKYTKHQVKRNRDLNDKYFEVVFQRDTLNFVPGSSVTLYNGPDYPVFIASGIQECWIRLIMNREIFSKLLPGSRTIKLNLEIKNKLPSLMAEKKPSFVFDTETIGAFFSWASTYPGVKCKVLYLGSNKIQEDWIKANHKIVNNVSKMKRLKELYVTGNRENFTGRAAKLLNTCKEKYII